MRRNCAAALALLLVTVGCALGVTKNLSRSDRCPPQYPFEYLDQAHGFRICVPRGVTKEAAADYPIGSIRFRGFRVPAKTNLKSKQLVIVAGDYDLLRNATAFGKFRANGVTFTRA